MKLSRLNILLIEDNPADQLLFQEYLSDTSLKDSRVHIYDRFGDGIRQLILQKPNLLMLDLSLPDSFGLDGLLKIKQIAGDIPVIILTGLNDDAIALKAIKHGAQDYLVKGAYDETLLEKTIFYSLERQRLMDELHQIRLELMSALIEGQEIERKRIARDLHDSLGQIIASAYMHCQVIQAKHKDVDFSLPIELLQNAIKEYRAVSHNLMPPSLDENGFIESLSKLCTQTAASTPYTVTFKVNKDEEEFAPEIKRELFRVVQELIHNAVKHAEGTTISVSLNIQDKVLTVDVEDDGRGFNPEEVMVKAKGIGLRNINARIHVLNGNFEIESRPGEGSRFRLIVPIDSDENISSR